MRRRIRANLWWLIPLLALMAFALQDLFRALVITPLAYAWFRLGLYYRSVSQPVYWLILTGVVGMIALGSLAGDLGRGRVRQRPIPPPKGQVEALAFWLARTRKGTYFKWLMANRLGRLARSLVSRDRPPGPGRIGLDGRGWDAPPHVQDYLEAGLERSSTDFNQPKLFSRPKKTVLDIPVSDAVDYLEDYME